MRPQPSNFYGMISGDQKMIELFRLIAKVGPEDVTVLIRGETGSGKELVAAALHGEAFGKTKKPFRAINCAALPAALLESELFGHVRGAFTGALKDVPGYFQLASGGTLFLDEIAELPLDLQAKLLRVLETRTVIPVGGREPIAVSVRIISATHRSLRAEVAAGRFRADLMYRLRVVPLFLPPLRQRVGDVSLLLETFVSEMNQTRIRKIATISERARQILTSYSWPGNVRELRNVMTYAYVVGDGPVLLAEDLPPELTDPSVDAASDANPAAELSPLASAESEEIQKVLRQVAGNRGKAAKKLGISRITLWRRMQQYGLLPST